MMKAEQYINVGYQKILTFERPGGGFDWWGRGPALVWLTAYGVQQLTATARVRSIDTGVINRAHQFLSSKQNSDGSWGVIGGTHGETIARVKNPNIALTAYVAWSLAEANIGQESVTKALSYLEQNYQQATSPYVLAIMANAFAFANPKSPVLGEIFTQLENSKKESVDLVWWQTSGQTATCAYGTAAYIETTAMVAYAMIKAQVNTTTVNRSLNYIVAKKGNTGIWGSTQATILALKTLVASEVSKKLGGDAQIDIFLNSKKVGTWNINNDNREVLQQIDLGPQTLIGTNSIQFRTTDNANVMYQVASKYYIPWPKPVVQKPKINIDVTYDRNTLAQNDTIIATATMNYHGKLPTFMVIIDLGIPPGFAIDRSDFAQLLTKNKIQRFSTTSRQITLYLGDVKPGAVFTCNYRLKAKYPLRVKTPKSTAYEYYSPDIRSDSRPVELVVEKKS